MLYFCNNMINNILNNNTIKINFKIIVNSIKMKECLIYNNRNFKMKISIMSRYKIRQTKFFRIKKHLIIKIIKITLKCLINK